MEFHLPSLQGQTVSHLTQDYAQSATLYAATGALAYRVSPLSLTNGLVFGLINSVAAQFGHSIVKTDETAIQKLLVSMGSITISTLLMTTLVGRVGYQLNVSSGVTLALLNSCGEVVKTVVIPQLSNFFFAPAAPKSSTPETAADIKKLSEADVQSFHHHYGNLKEKIGKKALPALHARFYELDLSLPEGKNFQEMRKAGESFAITELELPKTALAAEGLTKNQLSWLAFSLLQHKGLSKADFDVQFALRKVMAVEIGFHFIVQPKSPADVDGIKEDDYIRALHQKYTSAPHQWQARAQAVKEALNVRFKALGLKEISMDFQLPKTAHELAALKTLEAFKPVYDHFNKIQLELAKVEDPRKSPMYAQRIDFYPRDYKIEFNKKVSEFTLSPLQ